MLFSFSIYAFFLKKRKNIYNYDFFSSWSGSDCSRFESALFACCITFSFVLLNNDFSVSTPPSDIIFFWFSLFTDKFLKARAAWDCKSKFGFLHTSIIGSIPPNLPISTSFTSFTAKFAKAAIASISTPTFSDFAAAINGGKPPALVINSLLSSKQIYKI